MTKDPEARLRDDCQTLCREKRLTNHLDVPHAASPITIEADFARRALVFSMALQAPGDKKQARAHETWIRNQLALCEDKQIRVQANWPGRASPTSEVVERLGGEDSKLIPSDTKALPTSFVITRLVDLGAKFGQTRNFVDYLTDAMRSFYENVGQHLVAWHAPAPKVKDIGDSTVSDVDGERPPSDDQLVDIVFDQ